MDSAKLKVPLMYDRSGFTQIGNHLEWCDSSEQSQANSNLKSGTKAMYL